jgi:hypothetical protein
VNTDTFIDWLSSRMSDVSGFEWASEVLFDHICDRTSGWASPCKLAILNYALSLLGDGEEYLEIGSYTGRSIVGALTGNNKLAQVIDPFELFLPDGAFIYTEWLKTVTDFDVFNRITLHKTLCQNFDGDLPPIGVYYYDGDHDSGHTYEGLKKFEKYLADKALIIVDDYSIYGGPAQRPYPGHRMINQNPVEVDVHRWLDETPNAILINILPWENRSAVISYER